MIHLPINSHFNKPRKMHNMGTILSVKSSQIGLFPEKPLRVHGKIQTTCSPTTKGEKMRGKT